MMKSMKGCKREIKALMNLQTKEVILTLTIVKWKYNKSVIRVLCALVKGIKYFM